MQGHEGDNLISSDLNRSLLYPDAQCLWEGQIEMADVIRLLPCHLLPPASLSLSFRDQ